jgi:hypothetical protein
MAFIDDPQKNMAVARWGRQSRYRSLGGKLLPQTLTKGYNRIACILESLYSAAVDRHAHFTAEKFEQYVHTVPIGHSIE